MNETGHENVHLGVWTWLVLLVRAYPKYSTTCVNEDVREGLVIASTD